jgi:hypothetical protein
VKKFLIGVGVFIVVLYFVAFIIKPWGSKPARVSESAPAAEPVPSKPAAELSPQDKKMMRDLEEAKLVESVNPDLNEAYVNPLTWAGMKFDEKKHLAWFLATYCGKKKGTGLNWVEIKDVYSGKVLAKYSESWGFKVY